MPRNVRMRLRIYCRLLYNSHTVDVAYRFSSFLIFLVSTTAIRNPLRTERCEGDPAGVYCKFFGEPRAENT